MEECDDSILSIKKQKMEPAHSPDHSNEHYSLSFNELEIASSDISVEYAERRSEPVYLIASDNLAPILTCSSHRKREQLVLQDQVHSEPFNKSLDKVNLLNGSVSSLKNSPYKLQETLIPSKVRKWLNETDDAILQDNISEEMTTESFCKLETTSKSSLGLEIDRIFANSKCDKSISETNLFERSEENLNISESHDQRENLKSEENLEDCPFSTKQEESNCNTKMRLSHTDYNSGQQHPFLVGVNRVDPWSVPELYLDSIEIEIVVCKGGPLHKKREIRSQFGTIEIIPLDDSPALELEPSPISPPPIKLKPMVNTSQVKLLNIFKPHIIRPKLLLDNILPVDVVSAPFMDYIADDCEREGVGKKSIYLGNLLNDMKFNEAFLQPDFTAGESSFHELLGINLFDTGITPGDSFKTQIKEEVNVCQTCFRDIDTFLNCTTAFDAMTRDNSMCKCNLKAFKCYRNRNRRIYAQPSKFSHNCVSESLDVESLNPLLQHVPTDDRFNSGGQSSIDYVPGTNNFLLVHLPPDHSHMSPSHISYEKYGNLKQTSEYFEDLETGKATTLEDINFYCEDMFILEEDSFNNEQVDKNGDCPETSISNTSICRNSSESQITPKYPNDPCTPEEVFPSKDKEEDKCNKYFTNVGKKRKKLLQKKKQLPTEKRMLQNPHQTLHETGWIISAGNHEINCALDSDCPTVVPFSLKGEYFDPSRDLVSWNFDNSVTEEKVPEKKVEPPIEKKKKPPKEPANATDDRFYSKLRPINAVTNCKTFNILQKIPHPTAFVRHFGSFFNRIPRVSDDCKIDIQSSSSKFRENDNDLKVGVLPQSETSIVKVPDDVSSLKIPVTDATEENLVPTPEASHSSQTKSVELAGTMPKPGMTKKYHQGPKVSTPPIDVSAATGTVKKKRKMRCDRLSHSIFSSHLRENVKGDIPNSVCVLINGKVFVYSRNCS